MTKISLHKLISIIIVFLAATNVTLMSAQAGCFNLERTGDYEFWKYMGNRGFSYYDTRNWVASFYNLHASDWDRGWGYYKWDEPNPDHYAYPKMMNAGMMLLIGIEDRVRSQSDWKVTSHFQSGGVPAAVSRMQDSVDVFLRSDDNKLMHYTFGVTTHSGWLYDWEIGELPPSTMSERVFIFCDNCQKEDYLGSDPVAISHGQDNMDVFFATTARKLIRKTWTNGSWGVDLATDTANRRPSNDPILPNGPYYFDTKPVVVQRTTDTYDVFGLDLQWNGMIHYYYSSTNGWRAEDLTVRTGRRLNTLSSGLVVVSRNANILDVFGVDINRNLFHCFGSPSAGWTSEILGKLPLDSTPTVISRVPDTLDVFAQDDSHHLIHYNWSTNIGWQKEDLTVLLGANEYFVEGRPAVVLLDQPGGQVIHVFAREHLVLQRLYHFYWSSNRGWTAEGLSGGIMTDPVALSRQDRLDVVALNGGGDLIHYYWTALQGGWLVENVNLGPHVSPVFDTLEGSPFLVSRNENTVDVIGRKGNDFRFFTSANGNTATSWHTNQEYSDFAAGSKHSFRYRPSDDSDEDCEGAAAYANYHPNILIDAVHMCCPSFNGGSSSSVASRLFGDIDPSVRAAEMVHEATHENFNMGHDRCGGTDCDIWLFHRLRDPWYTLGRGTWPASGAAVIVPTHTPYQLTVEYACDIGEFPRDDLPESTYIYAKSLADFMFGHIKNPPGWTCGIPRPIY